MEISQITCRTVEAAYQINAHTFRNYTKTINKAEQDIGDKPESFKINA